MCEEEDSLAAVQTGTGKTSLAQLQPQLKGLHLEQQLMHKKIPRFDELRDSGFRSLAMTYSHMGKPHTTIGDASFHF